VARGGSSGKEEPEQDTRVAGRWEEAARHYTEPQLAALVISIATINAWNRLQAVTRQISGDRVEQVIAQPA
jgi:alkylhydroperoxidase family enzyme